MEHFLRARPRLDLDSETKIDFFPLTNLLQLRQTLKALKLNEISVEEHKENVGQKNSQFDFLIYT